VARRALLCLLVLGCHGKGPDGVEECEDYFALVEHCKNEVLRPAYRNAADRYRRQWRDLEHDAVREQCSEQRRTIASFCE
jgi:hypothetical protein